MASLTFSTLPLYPPLTPSNPTHSLLSKTPSLQFPLAPSTLSHRTTALRPLHATAAPRKSKNSNLTLEEACTLVDYLQEKLGVSTAAEDAGAVVVEEKTKFDVVMEEVPSNARIGVIKAVRGLTSLALKEAKKLIEGLPKKFKGVSMPRNSLKKLELRFPLLRS
ncbi:hypothetical protein GQ457_05G018430 [Hibiscus cannabinus]